MATRIASLATLRAKAEEPQAPKFHPKQSLCTQAGRWPCAQFNGRFRISLLNASLVFSRAVAP
jgi:hypothetical protein